MDLARLEYLVRRILRGRPFSMLPEDRLTRYGCYQDIQNWLRTQNKKIEGDVLCVSGVPPFVDRKNSGVRLTETAFPEVDIQKLPYADGSFDWVITDQVLEHVKDPRKAVAESLRVLRKGGIAIHTTVSTYMQHDSPGDYWRFMPEGLKELCGAFSKIHRCHFWGSGRSVRFMVDHPALWDDYRAYVTSSREILEMARDADPDWPIIVWVIAEK